MGTLIDAIRAGRTVPEHRPWPRAIVSRAGWEEAAQRLHSGDWSLLGLWGEPGFAHLAVMERASAECAVLSFAAEGNRFPSVGRSHPPAIRLERAVRDLVGLEPEGLADARGWLDHGRWDAAPSARRGRAARGTPAGYPFLPAEGESLHQIPVGPVHAGIIEPGHFRFTANGETVVRLEERLGYVHKGIEALMAGASVERAAVLAGRVSGDSTVACALAFARAVEAALGVEVPPRAVWLRALAAELERLANHFGDIGAVCNDASFAMMHAQCGLLREQVLRTAEACFGHRLMMDRVIPGGVRVRPAARRRAARCTRWSPAFAGSFPSSSSCTTTPRRSRTAPSARASCRARSRSSSPPAATSGARRDGRSMRGARRGIRRTTGCSSRCRCSRTAT